MSMSKKKISCLRGNREHEGRIKEREQKLLYRRITNNSLSVKFGTSIGILRTIKILIKNGVVNRFIIQPFA